VGERFVAWRRDSNTPSVVTRDEPLPVTLARGEVALFTIIAIDRGVAVLGLTDKYLGPAAVSAIAHEPVGVVLDLSEPGDLTVWTEHDLASVVIDDSELSADAWQRTGQVLSVPASSFPPAHARGHRVRIAYRVR
jgi:hypothetical protein